MWFLPWIIAQTRLRHDLLTLVAGDAGRLVQIGAAELGWLSTPTLRNVRIEDPSGEELATIEMIRVEQSLFDLLCHPVDLGTVHVRNAEVHARLCRDGSNVEDLLQLLSASDSESPTMSPTFRLDIAGAALLISNEHTGDRCALHDARVVLDGSQSGAIPHLSLDGQLSAPAVGDGAHPAGRVHLECAFAEQLRQGGGGGRLVVALNADDIPLSAITPIVRRAVPDATIHGRLTCDVKCDLPQSGPHQSFLIRGSLTGSDLSLSVPTLLGNDVLQLAECRLAGRVDRHGDRITFDDVALRSDVAHGSLEGTLQAGAIDDSGPVPRGRRQCTFTGRVDLARLTAKLPYTFRLRDGLRITEAEIDSRLELRQDGTTQQLSGHINASEIRAVHGGLPLEWNQPVAIAFRGHRTGESCLIDEVTCVSDFLDLRVAGSTNRATLNVQCDLKRLKTELARFIDVGDVRPVGRAVLDAGFQRFENDQFEATATLAWKLPRFPNGADNSSEDGATTFSAVVSGTTEDAVPARLDDVRLWVRSPIGHVEAQLIAPVVVANLPQDTQFQVALEGDLNRLRDRGLIPDGRRIPDLAGRVKATGTVSAGRRHFAVEQLDVRVRNLHVRGNDYEIREPDLSVSATAQYQIADRSLSVSRLSLTGRTVQVESRDLLVAISDAGWPNLSGQVRMETELEYVGQCLPTLRDSTMGMRGRVAGGVNFEVRAGATHCECDLTIARFRLEDRQKTRRQVIPGTRPDKQPFVWEEDQLRVSGSGRMPLAGNRLAIDRFELASAAHYVTVSGTVADPVDECHVDLSGSTTLDLTALTGTIRSLSDVPVSFTGRHEGDFRVRGPLWPQARSTGLISPELESEFVLEWDSGTLYGTQIGPGRLDARVRDGIVHFAPIETDLNGGRLRLVSDLDLREADPTLRLARTTAAHELRLSPELCRGWLQYASPVMADTARVDGTISVRIDGGRIPLSQPKRADVTGTVTIHELVAEPGPLAANLLGATRTLRDLLDGGSSAGNAISRNYALRANRQDVDFRVVDGRVHHRRLAATLDDVTIRTHGWVSFDERMSLAAEIPLREEWIRKSRLLENVPDATLRIPVGGTLSQPQVDGRFIAQLARDLAGSAADHLIGDQIRKGLDRLFD